MRFGKILLTTDVDRASERTVRHVTKNGGPGRSKLMSNRGGVGGIPVRLTDISKSFGPTRVLANCSLEIPAGGFVTLLGPSGSGKTTLLRIIAGFLEPDAGEVRFDGRPMAGIPVHKRNIGMVFQNYALFPHMTVAENVAYPLRRRGIGEVNAKVRDTLAKVHLSAFADRMPSALSGGQRQRVAMARALVAQPPLLLLDEPLSALDKGLREQLKVELKTIHREARSTFINVTHDQSEALAMSDLVVVMDDGRIEQAGAPQTLWHAPANAWVARFLGGTNLLPAKGYEGHFRLADGKLLKAGRSTASGAVEIAFRPESITVAEAAGNAPDRNEIAAEVKETIFLGETVRLVASFNGTEISAHIPVNEMGRFGPGQTVVLSWPIAATAALAAKASA